MDWDQELHALVPRECIDPVTGAMVAAALKDPEVVMKANGLDGEEAPPWLRPLRRHDREGR